jgi:hypothetical protein
MGWCSPAHPTLAAGPTALLLPHDKPSLLALLRFGDVGQREFAAIELANYPDSAGMLGARLGDESVPLVRQAVLGSLKALNSVAAAAALLPWARSPDGWLRSEVRLALQGMPHALGYLVEERMSDPDPALREETLAVLADLDPQLWNRHPTVWPDLSGPN